MHFEFATAGRIVFGRGTLAQLPEIVRAWGSRPLVVTGANPERARTVLAALRAPAFACAGEPTLETVRRGVQVARAHDVIVGLGGGSAIDCAKAIAALTANSGEPLDYLEVIGKGRPLEHAPMPFVAVPTTAGTGAEVTRNAVLGSPEHGVKASLRSPLLLSKAAIVDPDLTRDLPPSITASTGLDALTQLIEPFVSIRANAFTDMLCREGLRRMACSLERAFQNGKTDMEARTSMSYASLLSGMALANAGLGVVHGFAAPLGGMLHAAHGTLCAAVLPHGIALNIAALKQRASSSPALEKYDEIARILTGNSAACANDAVAWLGNLCRRLCIPPLSTCGLTQAQIPELVEKAAHASSMKANPIVLTPDELTLIVTQAL